MAAASYTTDLTTIAIGSISVDTGTWDESSDAGWDTAGSMVDDSNLYYNGTACVSAQYTKDGSGSGITGPGTIMYIHGSAFTIPADGAALIHHLWAAPPALNTLAGGGIIILAGTTDGDFYGWKASGSDFAPAPRGGWANYAINPAIGTPDYTVGTVTTYNMIGVAVGATAQARGNPQACNAVRYGRCEAIFTDGDIANGYATFSGYAAIDSASANKWNLIDPVAGGYQVQGLMSLGASGTSVDFRDANVNISIINTINVTSAFNKIEVNNVASNIEWSAISISALGTVSIGSFEMIDNATVDKEACTFTDMGTFTYLSNATVTNSIYRRCGIVNTGTGSFIGCTFDDATGTTATSMVNLSDISDCTFNSDGTGHAVDLGTVAASITMSWDNQESGYAGTDGVTGNETILVSVDTGQTLTINVAAGASIPTIYNTGVGTVTVVSGQVTTLFTVKSLSLGTILVGARVYLEAAAGGPLTTGTVIFNTTTDALGQVTDTRSLASNQPVSGWIRMGTTSPYYQQSNISATIDNASGLTLTFQMVDDE